MSDRTVEIACAQRSRLGYVTIGIAGGQENGKNTVVDSGLGSYSGHGRVLPRFLPWRMRYEVPKVPDRAFRRQRLCV